MNKFILISLLALNFVYSERYKCMDKLAVAPQGKCLVEDFLDTRYVTKCKTGLVCDFEENEENGNNEYLYIKKNIKKENSIDINDICVVSLDIDGNVNLFENRRERTLFNLYELSTIPKDHKEKNFFSMGYAYYIKSNLDYFCISSDHGCYIIKDNYDDN